MANSNDKQPGLSPIQESSDLDLSFIISQLSSVSGNITDRTLEELLRDAESQPPSLSWCRPKELPKHESPPVIGNTNMFKIAIDTLSEITSRVQEKLTLDEGSAATYRLPTSARSKSTLSSKSDKISADPKSLPSNSALQKPPKRCTSQFTMNAAARIYGKKHTAAKQSKVQPMFVPSSSKPVKVTVTAGCNKMKGMLSNGKDDFRLNENKNVRDLWEENARLHSQIENIKTQLSAQSLPPFTPKKDAVQPDAVVFEQLRQFEEKLSSIRETYQVQLDKFNLKFEEFEKLHQKPVIHDVQVQTDLEKGESTNKTEVPNLDFDDLVLDSNLPCGNTVSARAEISAKSHKADKMTVRSCRSCSGFGNGGQKNLLNTIRKLQTELDVVKNVNKRLDVQLKSSKSRNFGKSAIKRQIGTQTIGLGCSSPQKCDMAVIEPSKTLVIENEGLQKKVEQLLKEVEILNEQKAMSLRLLQVKHEEEIEVLLEEKMQLSKKLDAVQNWTPCIGKFPY